MTDPAPTTPPTLRAWDPAAYRRLAADVGDEIDPARDEGEALAEQDRERGWTPAASPVTLWALLADVARGSTRSRAALAACVAHTRTPRGAARTGAPAAAGPLTLAPDPDTALVRALGGTEPKDRAAWPAYLASLAADVAGTEGKTAKGPLAHVSERAAGFLSDVEDEIQDAVAAAYEVSAVAGGWSDADAETDRQEQVATATDVLTGAVADRRVERAIAIAGAKNLPVLVSDDDPSALVIQHFATGLAVWREIVRAVVRGEAVPGTTGWKGALWGLQVAFLADDHLLVRTGSQLVREAADRARARTHVTG